MSLWVIFRVANCLFVRVCAITTQRVILITQMSRRIQVHTNVSTHFRGQRNILQRTNIIIIVISSRRVSFRITYRIFRIALFVSFQVTLQNVRVTFSMRRFMVSPIGSKATNRTRFGCLKVTGRGNDNRIATGTPTICSSAIPVSMKRTFRRFNSFRLISSFFSSRLTRDGVLGVRSPVTTSASICNGRSMAFINRVSVPTSYAILPTINSRLYIEATMCMCSDQMFLIQVRVNQFCWSMVWVHLTVYYFSNAYLSAQRLMTNREVNYYRRVSTFAALRVSSVSASQGDQ